MTLFCTGSVILPEHVVFPPDLGSNRAVVPETGKPVFEFTTNNKEPDSGSDLSLDGAMKRHVQFVYERANRNQRRTAKLLGVSRSTLARYLRDMAKK
jgi:transcriptional regulator with PAS, ATPase and Fis domain